mmetsp:Transcript_40087/g.83820  ORF Transcript_40087/g.83820 Transcript_40087/m.83820 type:complete len:104 (+) Transcript_40087:1194-1505(+)
MPGTDRRMVVPTRFFVIYHGNQKHAQVSKRAIGSIIEPSPKGSSPLRQPWYEQEEDPRRSHHVSHIQSIFADYCNSVLDLSYTANNNVFRGAPSETMISGCNV